MRYVIIRNYKGFNVVLIASNGSQIDTFNQYESLNEAMSDCAYLNKMLNGDFTEVHYGIW